MTIDELRRDFKCGKRLKYMFFWGHTELPGQITKACLSQWYGCRFTVNGITYHTAEQYMMSEKARLFGDEEIFGKIMSANNPGAYKKLGRMIQGFDENIWRENRFRIVVEGNTAKFSQNPELSDFLMQTGGRILVEASPYDRIWGIGMAQDDPHAENPLLWKGENLLGFALMETRETLK